MSALEFDVGVFTLMVFVLSLTFEVLSQLVNPVMKAFSAVFWFILADSAIVASSGAWWAVYFAAAFAGLGVYDIGVLLIKLVTLRKSTELEGMP